jgi:hypothetical protein
MAVEMVDLSLRIYHHFHDNLEAFAAKTTVFQSIFGLDLSRKLRDRPPPQRLENVAKKKSAKEKSAAIFPLRKRIFRFARMRSSRGDAQIYERCAFSFSHARA